MKNLKKVLRITGLILLIVLACFGVGIGFGVPIPEKRRRENIIELRTEIKNEDEEKSDTVFYYKQE